MGPGRVATVCAAVSAAVARRPWATVVGCAALFVASLWVSAVRLGYHTQRNDLISPNKPCQQRWQKYLDAFGDDDDLVVVIRGGTHARKTAAADAAADHFRTRPDLFDRVFHRVDLRPLADRAALFLSPTELAAVDARLDRLSPLLGPFAAAGWPRVSVQPMLAQGTAALAAKSTGPADVALLAELPAVLDAATAAVEHPGTFRNPWAVADRGDANRLTEPQYAVTPDGELAVVLARPRKVGDSFTPAQQAIDEARRLVRAANAGFPELTMGLTGLPVLETDEMAASDEDSTRASWLALVGVAVLYLVVYRGVRYPLLTVGALVVGTGWAVGLATLTVGHLNILSATFAVMLIGLGDYGVLWVARYDAERRLGRDHFESLRETAVHAGPSVVTAAATTALAFFATMIADFRAVAELGWIAGCGVLCCAVACLTLVPAVLTLVAGGALTPSPLEGEGGGGGSGLRFWRRLFARNFAPTPHPNPPPQGGRGPERIIPFPAPFLPAVAARPRLVVAVAVAILFAAAGFAGRVEYDANLLHLQADGLDSVAWERELVRHAAGATWDVLSVARDRDEALRLKAKYEQLPGVGRVVEAASLLPADQDVKLPVVAAMQRKLVGLPTTIPPPLPADASTLRELADRAAATTGPLAAAAGRFRAALENPAAEARVREFDRRLAAALHADLVQLKSVCTPRPITVADLPAAFRERYVGADGEFLVRAFAAGDLWEYPALAAFTAAATTVDAGATGKAFRTVEGLRQMAAGFARAGAAAVLVIVAVLWLDFRDRRRLLLGLLPLVAGAVATLGVMGLVGVPLNPANLIALPLVVGVGVDNGVHVLHDAGDRGRLSGSTGRGVLVAGLTTVLGFGTLMLARHRGMASLGLVLTLGVSFSMAAAVLVLPAVLRLTRKTRTPTDALVRGIPPAGESKCAA